MSYLTRAGSGGGSTYKGAWASGTAYSAGDQVNNSYGLYAALSAVPSGLTAPSLDPKNVGAATTVASNAPTVNDYSNIGSWYQAFTVGASALTVNIVEIFFAAAPTGAGTFQLGIASAIGATPSAITWVGATPPTSTNPLAGTIASPVSLTSTLPASITLAANTTYYIAARWVSGYGVGGIAENSANTSNATGITVGTDGYTGNTDTAAWSAALSRSYKFNLKGTPTTSYWSKIANFGADPASVPNINKGAWSSATAYAAGDQVTNVYSLYAALAGVPSGLSAPSVGPTYGTGPATGDFATDLYRRGASQVFSAATAFTVGTSNIVVSAITLGIGNYSTGSARVGIATAIGASPSAVTWLGATPPATAITNPAAGVTTATQTFSLPASLTLLANTQYWMVVAEASGVGAGNVTFENTVVGSPSGGIASIAANGQGSFTSGAAWQSGGGNYQIPFNFGQAQSPYWSKISTNSGATVRAVTAATTMTSDDELILANGTFTVTLPAVATSTGKRYGIKNTGTGTITIAPASGTIDGAANTTLTVQYSELDLVSDGTNWFTV